MKTKILLLTGMLLLSFSIARSQESTLKTDHTPGGTVNVLSSPDLYDLTIKWADEYNRLNPEVLIKVTKIREVEIAATLKAGTGIGFVSNQSDPVFHSEAAWNMVVGRNVIVPVMNSRNPFLEEIKRKGISPEAFARIMERPEKLTWGAILGNGQATPVHCYMVNDPSVKSGVADFLKINQGAINTMTVESGAALTAVIRNDPDAIGFCRMVTILDVNNQNLAENISLVPIDKNGNGNIDNMEKIYDNLQDFSRGVWIGKYPKALSGKIYAVSVAQNPSKNEAAFLTWVLAGGQQFLNPQGFSDLVNSERQTQLDKLSVPPVTVAAKSYNGYEILKLALLIIIGIIVIGCIVDMAKRTNKNKLSAVHGNLFPMLPVFDENSVILPKGLFFDKTHTWAHMETDGSVKVGIDDFLQHLTGPITSIGMKPAGVKVKKGDPLLTIIQKGKHLLIYSPVSGTITASNQNLAIQPTALNTAPYTDGWVYMIEPANWLREIQFLSMAEKYKTWLKDEFSRLKDFFAAAFSAHTPDCATIVMQDGGVLTDNILADLGPKVWEDFQTNFIDTTR